MLVVSEATEMDAFAHVTALIAMELGGEVVGCGFKSHFEKN